MTTEMRTEYRTVEFDRDITRTVRDAKTVKDEYEVTYCDCCNKLRDEVVELSLNPQEETRVVDHFRVTGDKAESIIRAETEKMKREMVQEMMELVNPHQGGKHDAATQEQINHKLKERLSEDHMEWETEGRALTLDWEKTKEERISDADATWDVCLGCLVREFGVEFPHPDPAMYDNIRLDQGGLEADVNHIRPEISFPDISIRVNGWKGAVAACLTWCIIGLMIGWVFL